MAEDIDMHIHNSIPSAPRELLHASPNPRKRKSPPQRGDSADAEGESVDDSVPIPKGEYETGRVMCEVCGDGVSFRDQSTGGFTLKHWDAHRQQCATTTQPVPDPVIYTPESTAEALANPPAKRRRAKRTEEERIDYLKADPYVAQFEAYRVLCASCDKWIRLRPNSTYCSIPWDAHRKSCLSKKINNKNGCALEERNSLLAKDPDVRKFDAERVLCNTCDRWIPVSPENHMQAVQKWLHHRSSCQKSVAQSSGSQPEASSSQPQLSLPLPLPLPPPPPPPPLTTTVPPEELSHASDISRHFPESPIHGKAPPPPPPILSATTPGSPSSSSFKDLTPTNFPAHESRRRNAEQRAATLKADPLIEEVEPNRVFCSLCKKWVQLRQDSSYCAYPWIQHRGKCFARHERRAQKAAEVAEMRAKGGQVHLDDGSLSDEDGSAEDELESEEPYEGGGPPDHHHHHHIWDDQQQQQQRNNNSNNNNNNNKPSRLSDFRYFYGAKKQRLENGGNRVGIGIGSGMGSAWTGTGPGTGTGSSGPENTYTSAGKRPSSQSVRSFRSHANANSNSNARGRNGDVDAHVPFMDAFGSTSTSSSTTTTTAGGAGGAGAATTTGRSNRRVSLGFADLDTTIGRTEFIFSSLTHLFTTTYDSSAHDTLTISSLLTYLNSAMPADKHEEFDTAEVVKAAASLQDRGDIVFEGDMVRLVD